MILFQILNALEISWLTHQFVHYDFHLGNVMIKDLTDTPLYNKDFLYKRYNDDIYWYLLPKERIRNHMVKIIDLGRSSLNAPNKKGEPKEFGGEHHHPRRIGPADGGDSQGISKKNMPNPYYDTRVLIAKLLMGGKVWWDNVEKNSTLDEIESFYAMADAALDISRIKRKYGYYSDQFNSRTLVSNTYILEKLDNKTEYLRSNDYFGLMPHEMLDTDFFDPLRKDVILDLEDPIVVSYPPHREELDSNSSPKTYAFQSNANTTSTYRCHACESRNPSYKTVVDNKTLYFCGPVCHSFHYQFDGKTVYR